MNLTALIIVSIAALIFGWSAVNPIADRWGTWAGLAAMMGFSIAGTLLIAAVS